MNNIYAGIGSRELPPDMEILIKKVVPLLSHMTLRSGGADGADTAFEDAHTGKKEIYLPWKGFNHNQSPLYHITQEAKEMAMKYHPMGSKLIYKDAVLKLMARNCYQVLGQDLNTPVDFIVCYTPDDYTGGTSQALRIARDLGIPYFNIKDPENIQKLYAKINT